jgi:hypothetical protein
LVASGVKVLPVLSCTPGSNSGRCDGAIAQARKLAEVSETFEKNGTQGLARFINPDGTGLGSGLTLAVRDLANYLAMDITLSVVNNPGFVINIQKCTNLSDPAQANCSQIQNGCVDTTPIPRNTITDCKPGATPRFAVEITNPLDPDSVPPNPNDPNGGYHFSLQLVGDQQYLLDEVPVYIIPTENMGPPPPTMGSGTYASSGTYEQNVFGSGCNYFQLEGESPGANTCQDQIDNDNDGKKDHGNDINGDGMYNMTGEYAPEPGCKAGSCMDALNNDDDTDPMNASEADLMDAECATTDRQDWTDLYFRADIPAGTSIDFYMCTAETEAALATDCTDASYSLVATVTSIAGGCATNSQCPGGFCGAGGQCQFINPPKIQDPCLSDTDCPNGTFDGFEKTSHCNFAMNQCQYDSLPAELGDHLMMGQNGQPFVRMRILLHANADGSATPTLQDWYLTYVCRASN